VKEGTEGFDSLDFTDAGGPGGRGVFEFGVTTTGAGVF
jgi:hypothetical protein